MGTWIFALALTLFAPQVYAQSQQLDDLAVVPMEFPSGYLKRIVVFPIEGAKSNARAADDAWWKVREQLTDTKRFWVASKRFLVQKDVFQPRLRLQPADAILLGQLLDSDALMLMNFHNRELQMTVYNRFDGSVLWTSQILLHPSVPIDEQLAGDAIKLVRDFIASMPYHGFQILDPIINKPVYEEGDVKLAKVDVGGNSRTVEGDPIQWVSLERTTNGPLFTSGSRLEVLAEGQVIKNDNGILLVEVKRARDISLLKTNTLIRLPKETEYLKTNFALQSTKALAPELRYTPMPPTSPENAETKPLVAALASIANIALFVLLAF